jgi:hypothetical protein
VDTLWSESSAEELLKVVIDETFLRLEMSGALYESMLVVDTRANGKDILERSIFLTLWLRVGDTVGSFGTSVRLMRFVMARASDILMD